MNAERLHAIVVALKNELVGKSVANRMQQFVNSLAAVVQQSNASTQQNLAASLAQLNSVLTDANSDRFSPAWRQIVREIGGEGLFGEALKESIATTLAKNQITPAIALQEFQQILAKLQEFETGLDQAVNAFNRFHIGDEKLSPGECEIGLLIPRQEVKNQLVDFADELKEIGRILNTFSEVATGKPDDLAIKTISSSDLLVYLHAGVPYAACLAVAVERIVALYKQLLEIRKLHQDIRRQGVPDEQTSGIENYANNLMSTGIEKASEEIVGEFYKGKDKGRKNELTIAVRFSMNKIANKIDHGFNVEVRVEPPAKDDPNAQGEEIRKDITLIQSASASMQFLKLEGQPLLRLPETDEKLRKKE